MRYVRRSLKEPASPDPNHSLSSALTSSARSSSAAAGTPMTDTDTRPWPSGAYPAATSLGKQRLLTTPVPVPFRYSTLEDSSGGMPPGAAKYRHVVPTADPALLGAAAMAPPPLPAPSSASAAGPSVATTTPPGAATSSPPCSVTAPWPTRSTATPHRTLPAGRPAASCCATAPIPAAGRQLLPVASMRMTNSNSLLLVERLLSKKIPPRKGRKKRSTISSENPTERSLSSMDVSGAVYLDSREPSTAPSRTSPTRTLSATVPTSLSSKDKAPSTGWRKGSATLWNPPSGHRTSAPA
mmetsp:Transcript_963/g.3108  ORF Transcript_963/g.3108 Transcript_963/m.3108 type:complete len:297 (-) Transcript_963:227-1117(-)